MVFSALTFVVSSVAAPIAGKALGVDTDPTDTAAANYAEAEWETALTKGLSEVERTIDMYNKNGSAQFGIYYITQTEAKNAIEAGHYPDPNAGGQYGRFKTGGFYPTAQNASETVSAFRGKDTPITNAVIFMKTGAKTWQPIGLFDLQ